jgi:uncharacterized coiled-coil DUF342 family protein
MSECPNTMQTEHIKELATLRSEVDGIVKKVDDISIMKDTLIELKALSKEQASYNKKFNEMYEKSILSNAEFSNTLININANLNSLNTEMRGTNERIDKVEVKIDEIDEKSKVDFLTLMKQYAIPVTMGGGIVYFILSVVEKI